MEETRPHLLAVISWRPMRTLDRIGMTSHQCGDSIGFANLLAIKCVRGRDKYERTSLKGLRDTGTKDDTGQG